MRAGHEPGTGGPATDVPGTRWPTIRSIDEILRAARRRLCRLGPAGAYAAMGAGAVLVDIRPQEVRAAQGRVPDAVHVERNVLEWRFDPSSPARLRGIASYDTHLIIMCVEGYASSLAASSLQDLGLARATDLDGGFLAWVRAGLPVLAGEQTG